MQATMKKSQKRPPKKFFFFWVAIPNVKLQKLSPATNFEGVFTNLEKLRIEKNVGITNDFEKTHVAGHANSMGSLTTPVPCFYNLCMYISIYTSIYMVPSIHLKVGKQQVIKYKIHQRIFFAIRKHEPRKKPSYFPLYWLVNRDP